MDNFEQNETELTAAPAEESALQYENVAEEPTMQYEQVQAVPSEEVEPAKKKKKKKGGKGAIAIILVCLLILGSCTITAGGISMYWHRENELLKQVMDNKLAAFEDKVQEKLENIGTLEAAPSEGMTPTQVVENGGYF